MSRRAKRLTVSVVAMVLLAAAVWLSTNLSVSVYGFQGINGEVAQGGLFASGFHVYTSYLPVVLTGVKMQLPHGVSMVHQYVVTEGGGIGGVREDPVVAGLMQGIDLNDQTFRIPPKSHVEIVLVFRFDGLGQHTIQDGLVTFSALGLGFQKTIRSQPLNISVVEGLETWIGPSGD